MPCKQQPTPTETEIGSVGNANAENLTADSVLFWSMVLHTPCSNTTVSFVLGMCSTDLLGDVLAALQVVVSVREDLGFHNGHQAVLVEQIVLL